MPRPRSPSWRPRERVREVLPSVRCDLEELVRIESVWADPDRRDEVHRSARAVAD
ncbi:hypothetical protein, partial [Mycobacterium tuberculosis]